MSKHSQYPGASSTPLVSTPKRARVAGSKNLKNHEWVLVHQHFLRRNRENKDTIFIIHGIKHDWHNVRRKITRACAALKDAHGGICTVAPFLHFPTSSLHHSLRREPGSDPIRPLPEYIQLRSPSPKPIPRPPVACAGEGLNSAPPATRTRNTLSVQATREVSDTSSNAPSSDAEHYDVVKAVDRFLRLLKVSELLDVFQKSDWSRPKPSETICTCSFGSIWVHNEDIIQTLVDRVSDLAAYNMRLDNNGSIEVVRELIRADHVSKSQFLETVVRHLEGKENGIKMLDWLASTMCLAEYGVRAMSTAAYQNNYAAVDTLLHAGVDINANISGPHPTPDCRCKIKVIEYAQLQCFNGETARVSDEMVAYLLGRGAEASMNIAMSLLGLLVCVLHRQDVYRDNIFALDARFLISRIRGSAHVMCDTESVLRTCIHETEFDNKLHMDRIWLLEELLKQATRTFSSLPLTALILKKGRWDLVENLIAKTENINSHCDPVSVNDCIAGPCIRPQPYQRIQSISPLQAAGLCRRRHVLRLLIEHGADVDCPAQGSCGVPPLQAICWWDMEPGQNLERKLLAVDYLLGAGANVNAAPAWHLGLSALQVAAFLGDIHVAKLLASRGADVNAPACKYGGGTALALAARRGHSNMVQFLLEAGAKVPMPGAKVFSSGVVYEDHKLILDLLCISAPELAAMSGANAYPPRDYHEYEAEWANDPTYEKTA